MKPMNSQEGRQKCYFLPHLAVFKEKSTTTRTRVVFCTTWDYNRRQLQGLTSNVCDKYCCLFALYMDRAHTPKQFTSLFDACNADLQVERLFATEFGA